MITKDEAPPVNSCNNIICDAPPKIIIDIPIVSKGLNPISIARTPNIRPKGKAYYTADADLAKKARAAKKGK